MKHVRSARGIRHKILYGFIILGALLFFSGMVSYIELSRLSKSTRVLMDGSIRDLELSKEMLDAAAEQNSALFILLHPSMGSPINADSAYKAGHLHFETAFEEASDIRPNSDKLRRVSTAYIDYEQAINRFRADTTVMDNNRWLNNNYKAIYYNLRLAVKDLMIEAQSTIDHNTVQIQDNAYRAITPGIIALGIAIIIVVIFFCLIDIYYIKPVIQITKALGNYLNSKIPFNVKMEGRDEVTELTEHIETLMTIIKKKENP